MPVPPVQEPPKHELSRLAARAHRRAVRRRWVRRTLIVVALVLIVGGSLAYTVRGPLTRRVALGTLEQALGYRAVCEPAVLLPDGRVSLPGLTLRAPDVDGPAGEVLTTRRVVLEVDWLRAVLSPADAVRSIHLLEPVVRVSVDTQSGELNLQASGRGGSGEFPDDLPPIIVESAELVFGEHGPGWFAPLDEIRVSGVLAPTSDGSDIYELRLREDVSAGRAPAILAGALDLKRGAGELRLEDVDFGALRVPGTTPHPPSLLRRLRVDGQLPLATLAFESDGGFTARLDLDGVEVLAPIPVVNPGAPGASADAPVALTGVTGVVELDQDGLHANFIGLFGDIDARVIIETLGYRADADVSAEFIIGDYRLGPDPALLPYAPELATDFVHRFSGPEASISGRVRLERAGGSVSASGLFVWRDGQIAFEDFPYPVSGISGRLTFDDGGVDISELTGVGPTGASVSATISAAPLGPDADITADIVATGVPVDEHLFDAIGGDRGRAVASLFQTDALPESARAALVVTDPGFSAGGELRLEIGVTKRGGEFGRWAWDVRAAAPEIAFAPEVLAYPLRARDFELHLDNTRATAQLPHITGPTGATGSAQIEVALLDADGLAFTPSVAFNIADVPIDAPFVAAVGHASPDTARLMNDLAVTGVFFAQGTATPRAGGLHLAGTAGFSGLEVRAPGEVSASARLDGRVELGSPEGDVLTAQGTGPGGAPLTLRAERTPEDAWAVSLAAEHLAPTPAVAGLTGVFDAAAGAWLLQVLEDYEPTGTLGVILEVEGAEGGPRWSVALDRFDNLAATLRGERLMLRDSRGRVVIESGGGLARFGDFTASVGTGEGEVARVSAAGTLRLDGLSEARLEARAVGASFDSPALRRAASTLGGERVAAFLSDTDPSGTGDITVVVRGDEGEPLEVVGTIEPRTLAVTRGGDRLEFGSVRGRTHFDRAGVRLDLLTLTAPDWEVVLDGRYEDGFVGRTALSASRLSPGLLAGVPEAAAPVVSAVGLRLEEGGRLRAEVTSRDDGSANLRLDVRRAAMELGVPITGADGALELSMGPGPDGEITGTFTLDSFLAASIPMHDAKAEVRWTPATRTLWVPTLEADCAGGVIRGQARLAPADGLSRGPEYFLDLRCVGVPLAWIVAAPGEREGNPDLDERGLISGRLTLRGSASDTDLPRLGRGEFAIRGGEVLRFPLLTPALELLNLQPPVGEELDDAAVEFGIDGSRLVFDRLFVQSRSIVVNASGEADLSDRSLNLAVKSRGRRSIPILSDLMNALRDELVAARVTGTIESPSYALTQLPNAGRVLLGAVAPGAGGRTAPKPPPARPPMVQQVLSELEPIDE